MPQEQINVVVRLNPEVYADLEKKFPMPMVTDNTSPTQAGYQLGIQAVLKALRTGYVVSSRNGP